MKKYIMTIILLTLLSETALSFDGNRKGFVLGGGIGFNPIMTNNFDKSETGTNVKSIGQSRTLFLGIGISSNDLLLTGYTLAQGESEYLDDRLFRQRFNGYWWYHYFTIKNRKFNSIIGLGFSTYHLANFDNDYFDMNFGYQLGLGYEIVPHVQLNLVFSEGKFSYGESYNYYHLTLQLHAIAY